MLCSLCLGVSVVADWPINQTRIIYLSLLFLWGLARAGGAAITFPKGHRKWGGKMVGFLPSVFPPNTEHVSAASPNRFSTVFLHIFLSFTSQSPSYIHSAPCCFCLLCWYYTIDFTLSLLIKACTHFGLGQTFYNVHSAPLTSIHFFYCHFQPDMFGCNFYTLLTLTSGAAGNSPSSPTAAESLSLQTSFPAGSHYWRKLGI